MEADFKAKVHDAVMALNPHDDANWSAAGLPDIDKVNDILGLKGKAKLGRADITEAASDVTRETAMEATQVERTEKIASRSDAAEALAEDPPIDDDPAMLMERFTALVQQERYRRNRVFMTIAHLWQAEQEEARNMQGRLDERHDRRMERRQREKVKSFEEEHAKQLAEEKKAEAAAAAA